MVAWRRDGQELYYLCARSRNMAVTSAPRPPVFEFGKPKLVFKAPDSFPVAGTPGGLASISRDGQRFALVVPPAPTSGRSRFSTARAKTVRKVGEPGLYDMPALSPDGTESRWYEVIQRLTMWISGHST